MKIEDPAVDYAPHYLLIETHLRTVHDLLKRGNYKDAATYTEQMMVECKLLKNAIKSHVKH